VNKAKTYRWSPSPIPVPDVFRYEQSYGYDGNGNVSDSHGKLPYEPGEPDTNIYMINAGFSYNGLDEVSAVNPAAGPGGDATTATAFYEYDAAGRLRDVKLGNVS
jgi:hypothetical protein